MTKITLFNEQEGIKLESESLEGSTIEDKEKQSISNIAKFKIGDKVYVSNNLKLKGEIINILSWKLGEFNRLDYNYKNSSENEKDLAVIKFDIGSTHNVLLRNLNKINDHQESEENIKDNIKMAAIGAERENGQKITWGRIDDLNLEFTVEGRIPMVTVIKVLIKNLDLKQFTYERVCPYKITHEYPKHNVERNHIFSVKWVDFDGNIKSQEIIRTDDSLYLTNCKIKVFIPDLLEVARMKQLVSLKGNTYIAYESKLNGSCNDFEPIIEINRGIFEKQGWQVPASFEKRFINNKRF